MRSATLELDELITDEELRDELTNNELDERIVEALDDRLLTGTLLNVDDEMDERMLDDTDVLELEPLVPTCARLTENT